MSYQSNFSSNGKYYKFSIKLKSYNSSKSFSDPIETEDLDISNVISFEFVNDINSLLLNGSLVYDDKFGYFNKHLDSVITYIKIDLTEYIDFKKNILSQSEKFSHTFLISDVKVVKMSGSHTQYMINLISANILNFLTNVFYSNYNKEKESCLQIAKTLFLKAKLKLDGEIDTTARINFISGKSESVLNQYKYLTKKMYDFQNLDNNKLGIVTYNDIQDKYDFVILNFPSTYVKQVNDKGYYSNVETIALSTQQKDFFGSIFSDTFSQVNSIYSVNGKNRKDVLKSLFKTRVYDYDYDTNEFETKYKDISQESIAKYYSTGKPSNKLYNFLKMLNPEIASLPLEKTLSKSDNQKSMFFDQATNLINFDSIGIMTSGRITRNPGTQINISLIDGDQNTFDNLKNNEAWKKFKTRYIGFCNDWLVTRVRHVISESVYTNNIILSRNFRNET